MRSSESLREHVLKAVAPLRETSVILRKTDDAETGSYLGGLPPACAELHWPQKGGRPLTFLGCIDMSRVDAFDWLPPSGLLLFFYDTEGEPWGSPDDAGGWAVRYVAGGSDKARPSADAPDGVAKVLPKRNVALEARALPPDWELTPLAYSPDLSEEEEEAACNLLGELLDREYGGPKHHLGGYAQAHQRADMMPFDCQLHSTGHRASEDLSDSDRAAVEGAASDWQLLLQVDSDPDLQLRWAGLDGRLFFWVRTQDARQSRFDGVWITFNR